MSFERQPFKIGKRKSSCPHINRKMLLIKRGEKSNPPYSRRQSVQCLDCGEILYEIGIFGTKWKKEDLKKLLEEET